MCVTRSGAAADRRTLLKRSAQLDLASSYAVLCTGRTESPTSLNYAKLYVEMNYTGAAIGEMWGDLAIRHIVFEWFMWTRVSRDSCGKAFVIDTFMAYTAQWKAGVFRCRKHRKLLICRVRKVRTRVSSYLSDFKLTVCARKYLNKILAYVGFRQRRPSIDVQRTPIYVYGILYRVRPASV